MMLVSIREAGIGLDYPCARCSEMFETAQKADAHMAQVHHLVWSRG